MDLFCDNVCLAAAISEGRVAQFHELLKPVTLDNYALESWENKLREFIRGELSFYEDPSYDAHPKNEASKWKCISGVQKGVRRGDVKLAQLCGHVMLQIDPAYLWNRLGIIAVEDLGYGGLLETALVFAAARFKKFRVEVGEHKLLMYIIQMMCSAVKDRSLCDVYCAALKIVEDLDTKNLIQLEKILKDDTTSPCDRTGALMSLAGVEGKPGKALFDTDAWVSTQEIPGLVLHNMIRAKKTQRYELWMGYVPVLPCLMEGPLSIAVADLDTQTGPYKKVAGVPEWVFDKHTQDGRRALDYFAKSSKAVSQFLRENNLPAKAVGIVVFTLESALLDRELGFPGRDTIYLKMIDRDAEAYGMTVDQFMSLANIFMEEREELSAARLRVIN